MLRHGLLSTSRLLDLFEIEAERRILIETRRRPARIELTHPVHGAASINDNLPLTETALASCLDDGLTPADWLRRLNARVFFWADEDGLATLLTARMNRGRAHDVLVFDTLSLAESHGERMELSPINSGSTLRKPARRGLRTLTPLASHSYADWRRLRGGRDRVREVAVLAGIAPIAEHLVEVRRIG